MSRLLSDVLSSNGPLVHRLIQALKPNDAWKSLRSVIPPSSLSETYSPASPDDLVLALQNSFVTVSDLVKWLELVDAIDALLLFKRDEPVVIVEHPEPYLELETGRTSVLRLTCRAKAFPPPNYEWYFHDKPLAKRFQTGPTLELRNLTEDHTGSYKCRAWNIRGSDKYSNVSAVVVSSPYHSNLLKEPAVLSATDKVAMLISNANYTRDQSLCLTESDVETFAKTLAAQNFRILAFKDLARQDIIKAFQIFRQFLRNGTYSVFYYAGHGFKQDGKDYLQPVDCVDSSPVEECVCFQEVVREIRSSLSSFNLILLDACRDSRASPRDSGPAAPDPREMTQQARRSSIVVYATSPYTSAVEVRGHQNGLFMEHLKRHVDVPVSVHDAIRRCLRDMEEHALADWQIPVVKYDIPGDHSLCDAIVDGPDYQENEALWSFISKLPHDEEFQVTETGIRLRVTFACEREVFCNSMVVAAILVPPMPAIYIDLRAVNADSVRAVSHSGSVLSVSNLQRLSSPLCLNVVLRDLRAGKVVYMRAINCGHPLVAAWNVRSSGSGYS